MTRDPRTYLPDEERVGALGHPGFGRDAVLFTRLMPWLKACVVEEARELDITETDLVNNILVERYRGKLQQPTPEQLAEAKTLTPAEAYQHLDPVIKSDPATPKEAIIEHLQSVAKEEPLTLERLEEEEDKAIDSLYQRQLNQAQVRATPPATSDPFGPRAVGNLNHERYKEEIRLARERKAREDRARAKRREQRRLLLSVAALMVAPQLRREGDPRLHRQYEDRSHWSTMGGYTRRDVAEADLLAPKDTS